MRLGNSVLALGVLAVLVAGSGTWVAQPAAAATEAAPAYSLEGAWYGTVTVGGQPTLSLDT